MHRSIVILTLLALASPLAAARAQQADTRFDAVLLDRLGLLERPGAGARSLAMGGETAWTEDVLSLTVNPAGLAAITRIETQLGFRRQVNDQAISYFGTQRRFDAASTSLDGLGFAYPFPVYRGSFVVAAGVFRAGDSILESIWEGTNAYDGDEEVYTLQLDGGQYSWVAGGALAVSPTTEIGLSVEHLRGDLSLFSRFDYGAAGADTLYRSLTEDDFSLRGWRAHLGLMSRPWPGGSLGLRVTTPTALRVEGESRWEDQDIVDGETSVFDSGFFISAEDLRLPYRIAFAVSQSVGFVRLSAGLDYADWNQTTVDGRRLKDLDLRAALGGALDQGYGLEIAPPRLPLRVNFAYRRLEEPLRLLESGEFVAGEDGVVAALKTVEALTPRRVLAAGVGLYLSDNLLWEIGVASERMERRTPLESSGVADIVQESERTRVTLSFSYRL